MSSTAAESTRAPSPADKPRLPPGVRPVFAKDTPVPGLSSWVLDRKLGGGGFGEVWLAKHAWDAEQKPRAVKFCTDPEARHRLVTHEKNVVLRVMKYAGKHPNIVPLLDCNLDGEVPWLMYEFVEGGTLASAVAHWRKLPPHKRIEHAVRTLHDIAGALGTFHHFDPPLVHRDMKPHNVLMAGNVPRITDFGIGGVALRPRERATGSATEGAAQVPDELRAAGTRVYAPQEQLFGSAPDPRDDVYALGIIAYQLVTADLSAGPGSDAEYELRRLQVPDELIALIVTSASINPERRPRDASVWEQELVAVIRKLRGDTEADVLVPHPPTDLVHHTELATARTAQTRAEPVAPRPPAAKKPDWRVWDEPERPRRTRTRASGAWVALGGVLVVASLLASFVYLLPGGKQRLKELASEVVETGPAPGDTRDAALPGGAKMTFCWVPPGECRLGSPKAERDAVRKQLGEDATWLADEAEERRGTFRTKGFWMAKHEVTQAEWAAVMRDTPIARPSYYRPAADAGRFPVEGVSWTDAQQFVEKLNGPGGATFGGAGRFALPHEDAWEYACRGGKGNGQPFYFGAELNGNQANVDGGAPFGTATKGPNLGRPAAVGASAARAAHPWGLCDMQGNVWEWCENRYEGSLARVVRGGSWFNHAHDARSANRGWHAPDARRRDVGVRICWAPAD